MYVYKNYSDIDLHLENAVRGKKKKSTSINGTTVLLKDDLKC